jgi:hypothetical protein
MAHVKGFVTFEARANFEGSLSPSICCFCEFVLESRVRGLHSIYRPPIGWRRPKGINVFDRVVKSESWAKNAGTTVDNDANGNGGAVGGARSTRSTIELVRTTTD